MEEVTFHLLAFLLPLEAASPNREGILWQLRGRVTTHLETSLHLVHEKKVRLCEPGVGRSLLGGGTPYTGGGSGQII